MNFAEAAKNETKWKRTENGQPALNTTGDAVLDFYGSVGAMRGEKEARVCRLFAEAYAEDPLLTMKATFWLRDIRGGAGERDLFRMLIGYMAKYHPEAIRCNMALIPEYGRWDDLYAFFGTPLEDDMWAVFSEQLDKDLKAMNAGGSVSLLAKWLKTPDSSVKATAKLGKITAEKLGYMTTKAFTADLRSLRAYLKIVERQMCSNKWAEIDYSAVPSRAGKIYRNAFRKHDGVRYDRFINKAVNGEAKINSSTLYPYDLIEAVMDYSYWETSIKHDDTVEAQWRQLPNYVDGNANAIVIADTSGSMNGRPLSSALGLAIYFAERNTGAYHNLFMTFSADSKYQKLKGETLVEKLESIDMSAWGNNTNLERAFQRILNTAINNHVSPDDMPKAIIVVSDMEIDAATTSWGHRPEWTFYDEMKSLYKQHGYQIPNIVFWNVKSRHDTFHADKSRRGVQLVSGQSASTFRNLMSCVGLNPMEAMLKVLNSDRYAPITID